MDLVKGYRVEGGCTDHTSEGCDRPKTCARSLAVKARTMLISLDSAISIGHGKAGDFPSAVRNGMTVVLEGLTEARGGPTTSATAPSESPHRVLLRRFQ